MRKLILRTFAVALALSGVGAIVDTVFPSFPEDFNPFDVWGDDDDEL